MMKFSLTGTADEEVVVLKPSLKINSDGSVSLMVENENAGPDYVITIGTDGYIKRHDGVDSDLGLKLDRNGYVLMHDRG